MATGSLLATRSTILAPTDTRSCSRADHWQRLEAAHIEIAPSGHRATRFEASERTHNGPDRQPRLPCSRRAYERQELNAESTITLSLRLD